eukprot:PhF_6_TR37884/c0_g1_i1/m.56525
MIFGDPNPKFEAAPPPGGGISLVCTVCGTTNKLPLLHPNWTAKDSTNTFCVRCNNVTTQRNPNVRPGVPEVNTTEPLWNQFLARLKGRGASLDDVKHCDAQALEQMWTSLGFEALQRAQLQSEWCDRVGPLSPMGSPSPIRGSRLPPFPTSSRRRGTSNSLAPISTNVEPLYLPDQPYCCVHENRPAEFWCCMDRVMLCSRCHVQGAHKDHPFISLVEAARSQVPSVIAWCDRSKENLRQAANVSATLAYGQQLVKETHQRQVAQLRETVNRIQQEIKEREQQLMEEMEYSVIEKLHSMERATQGIDNLITRYHTYIRACEPLVANVPPPVNNPDDETQHAWAGKILAVVQQLQQANIEPTSIPIVTLPQVVCNLSQAMMVQVMRMEMVPSGLRLPEVVDSGAYSYPYAAGSKVCFSLIEGVASEGIVLTNDRLTLTRSPNTPSMHRLVLSSQVFYSGVAAWSVHIDRIGPGPGHILCGVMQYGSEGEGVVWDGSRIVGPNEREERTVEGAAGVWRSGAVLGFILDLEPPGSRLTCTYNHDTVVARINLPTTSRGWCPAFSVHCALDQITVLPASDPRAVPAYRPHEKATTEAQVAVVKQQQILDTLHDQIQNMNNRFTKEQQRQNQRDTIISQLASAILRPPQSPSPARYMPTSPSGSPIRHNRYPLAPEVMPPQVIPLAHQSPSLSQPPPPPPPPPAAFTSPTSPSMPPQTHSQYNAPPLSPTVQIIQTPTPPENTALYSEELLRLMQYVNEMKTR